MNYRSNRWIFSSEKYPSLYRVLFIMKCISLFIILGTLQSLASLSYSQVTLLTFEKKDASVLDVLSAIENQSEFYFTYNQDQIDVARKTSVRIEKKSISEILDVLFADEGIKYSIIDRHIVLYKDIKSNTKERARQNLSATKNSQQTKTITGTVIDEYGEPLIGVNVAIKGSTNGTITALDGTFSLQQVPESGILVISYVGYVTQEIVIGNSTHIAITLKEDTQSLDEVVVVGYGVQKKQTLSGSVTSIGSDDISTTKTENLITNIQGKMPGLLIRQKTGEPGVFDNMVSIRGYGDPLVVIDGVTRDGTTELAQLNPDDIESISILKDASAAIYGMNAANGVIIVTTKKGQDGKARFSYSGMYGLKVPTGMEMTVDAYTYRVMANEMQRNIGATATYGDEILEKYRNNEPGYTDNNWLDMFMHDVVPQQNHTVSVRGGSDKVKYFSSFGYTEDNGLLKSDIQYYQRYNFRTNVTADLTNNLSMAVSVSGRFDKSQQPREPFIWTFKTLMVNDRGKGYHTMANEKHLSAIDPENKNPYALVDPDVDGYRRNRNFSYQSNVELTYKVPFAKGLNLSLLGAFDGWDRNYSELQKSYKLYDYYTDAYITTYGTDKYRNNITQNQKAYGRFMANYTHSWNQIHNLNLTAVAEITRMRKDYLRGDRQYLDLYTHDILNQGATTTASNEGYREFRKMAAYLARLNYDYAGKYLLEAVIRYDGSYRYARSKRWSLFPSVSAGWRISEEAFIKNSLPFVSNLKLRASYGESGRDTGDPFQYVAGYTAYGARGYVFSDSELTVGMIPPGVVNDNLSWITSKTSNIGLDFDLWNGLIGGAVDVFQRKNTGILATRVQSVPNTFGASFPDENINSNKNMGVEFELRHNGEIGKDFSYMVSANITYARTKTLHDERAEFTSSWDRWRNGKENRLTGGTLIYSYNGQYTSLNQYETAPLLGGNQGNSKMLPGSYAIIDKNGDGIINDNDQTFDNWGYGWHSVNPPLQYGMTLGGAYKGFDLNMLWQGAALYAINYRNNDIWGYGRYPTLHEKFLDRWHTENITDDPYNPATSWISGRFPAIRSNFNNTTDSYVVDVWRPKATYLRLKSLEIGYTLPKSVLNTLRISSVRLFVNGTNLLTFCKRELKDADPERHENEWDAGLSYPLMRSYNFGLNVNF